MTDKSARGIIRAEVWDAVGTIDGERSEHIAGRILAALDAGGFAVVPKEPGDDVRKAMYATWDSFGDVATMGPREAVALYRAMLSNPKEEAE